jgi:hypothetical protein
MSEPGSAVFSGREPTISIAVTGQWSPSHTRSSPAVSPFDGYLLHGTG